jgi:hypothetical protein
MDKKFLHVSPHGRASGPFPFLNPTTRRFPVLSSPRSRAGKETGTTAAPCDEESSDPSKEGPEDEVQAAAVEHKWRSRDNRKGTTRIETVKTLQN